MAREPRHLQLFAPYKRAIKQSQKSLPLGAVAVNCHVPACPRPHPARSPGTSVVSWADSHRVVTRSVAGSTHGRPCRNRNDLHGHQRHLSDPGQDDCRNASTGHSPPVVVTKIPLPNVPT